MKIDINNELCQNIETLRMKMINLGCKKGLSNLDTIKYSQKLDELLYKQQILENNTWSSKRTID